MAEADPYEPTQYIACDRITKCLNCGAWCLNRDLMMRQPETPDAPLTRMVLAERICGGCVPKLVARFAALASFPRGTYWQHDDESGLIE